MQPLQYSELPQEEESVQVQVQSETGAKKPRRQISLTNAALLLTIALLISVVAITRASKFKVSLNAVVDETEWLRSYRTRASGDEYLIGVGKADITGHVSETQRSSFR